MAISNERLERMIEGLKSGMFVCDLDLLSALKELQDFRRKREIKTGYEKAIRDERKV